jgi:hypothetical protein
VELVAGDVALVVPGRDVEEDPGAAQAGEEPRRGPPCRVLSCWPCRHPPHPPRACSAAAQGHGGGGEPACRPGSVPALSARAAIIHLGLPLPTASCGLPASIGRAALKRSRRPLGALLDLAPGGVYLAVSVTCDAGGLLHHRFTLTLQPRLEGGLLSVALSRGSPRIGVTDRPAVWSPDLPHRIPKTRRDRPADSPVRQDTPSRARAGLRGATGLDEWPAVREG